MLEKIKMRRGHYSGDKRQLPDTLLVLIVPIILFITMNASHFNNSLKRDVRQKQQGLEEDPSLASVPKRRRFVTFSAEHFQPEKTTNSHCHLRYNQNTNTVDP